MHSLRLLALCALASPWSAFADETGSDSDAKNAESKDDTSANSLAPKSAVGGLDIEDRKADVPEATRKPNKLQTRVFFETEWHEFDNLDFRALDESSDQAILDSDDRGGFAFTGISLDLAYQPDKSTRLVLGTSYRGLWGNDQIGNANRFGGFLYFTALYVEYTPQKWAYQPTFKVGRMRFDLGGQGGAREYILGDIVDQVQIDLPLGKFGTLSLIPINLVGFSQDNDDVNFVSFIGQSSNQTFGFRGDRMTRRHGALLNLAPEMVPGLDARAYGFYTDMGALGSGSDITYNGRLGNFSDNDWVANFGVRVAYTALGWITPFASFDASVGVDRKELVTNDVDTNGFAWSGGVTLDKDKDGKRDWGVRAELSYFEAQGPTYQDNGQQFSHGYVGMKARQVGGLLTNRFLGWHPTSYVGSFGLETTPQETDRKSGTRVITLNGDVFLPGPVSLMAGYWFLQDTGLTTVNANRIDTLTPPFGYSREEYEAQARLGKVLGHEIDFGVGVTASKHLSFYAQAGVLLPGAYYGIPIGRVAGTALGSDDPQLFWDASAGASLRF